MNTLHSSQAQELVAETGAQSQSGQMRQVVGGDIGSERGRVQLGVFRVAEAVRATPVGPVDRWLSCVGRGFPL